MIDECKIIEEYESNERTRNGGNFEIASENRDVNVDTMFLLFRWNDDNF